MKLIFSLVGIFFGLIILFENSLHLSYGFELYLSVSPFIRFKLHVISFNICWFYKMNTKFIFYKKLDFFNKKVKTQN